MSGLLDDISTVLKNSYSQEMLAKEMEKQSPLIAYLTGSHELSYGSPKQAAVLLGISDDMLLDEPLFSTVVHDLSVPDEAPEVFIDLFPTGRLICLEER